MPTRPIRSQRIHSPSGRRVRRLAMAMITTAAAAASVPQCPPVEARTFAPGSLACSKRNILLIIADGVGIDELPSYYRYYNGNARRDDDIAVTSQTPFYMPKTFADQAIDTPSGSVCLASIPPYRPSTIDRLAVAGVTFLNAWASPTSSPTRASLAEALVKRGYTTGLFGQVPVKEAGGALTNDATSENTRDAVGWINQQTRHWMATVSYTAARMEVSADNQGMPRAAVEYVDSSIKTLLDGIKPSVLSYTTIIFIGDHGTEGCITGQFNGADGSLAKCTQYEGGIRVPFIIADGYVYVRGKEAVLPPFNGTGHVVAPGRYEAGLVQAADLFATVADIACAEQAETIDSINLAPILRKPGESVRDR